MDLENEAGREDTYGLGCSLQGFWGLGHPLLCDGLCFQQKRRKVACASKQPLAFQERSKLVPSPGRKSETKVQAIAFAQKEPHPNAMNLHA